jgi:hypothetical protein
MRIAWVTFLSDSVNFLTLIASIFQKNWFDAVATLLFMLVDTDADSPPKWTRDECTVMGK